METQIGKWGNSLALRIPKNLAEEAGLTDGGKVEVTMDQGKLIIQPAPKAYSLEELVAGVKDENRHTETAWGAPRGDEVW